MVNEVLIDGFNDDSGFLSDQSRGPTPLKKRPHDAVRPAGRRAVKRRLFQEGPLPKKQCLDLNYRFELEVESIVKYCRRMKTKLPSGPNRSPGTPYDNWCFSRIKTHLKILQMKLEDSLQKMMKSSIKETIELCLVLWPLLCQIPSSWELKSSRRYAQRPLLVLSSYLSFVLINHRQSFTTEQLINLSERLCQLSRPDLLVHVQQSLFTPKH